MFPKRNTKQLNCLFGLVLIVITGWLVSPKSAAQGQSPTHNPHATPTATPSPTATPRSTVTPTPNDKPKPSVTPTPAPSVTPTPRVSPTASVTPTPSVSPTPQATPRKPPTAGPPTIQPNSSSVLQFSAETYTVAENGKSVTVRVVRTGDTSGEAAIDYDTKGGTAKDDLKNEDEDEDKDADKDKDKASNRSDYVPAMGTLRFAAGETAKSFVVSVIDDTFVERDEFVQLLLKNPRGAIFHGSSNHSKLVIKDNDTGTATPNPVSNKSFFVRQQYLDFLSREPEEDGFNAWKGVLDRCTDNTPDCDEVTVSASFFRSEEFQGRGYFAYRFYEAALGRRPTHNEFLQDLGLVNSSETKADEDMNKQALADDFVERDEFKNRYAGLSASEFVDKLLQTAGVKLPHRNEIASDLENGVLTPAQALREVVESDEVSERFHNRAFVAMQYFGYLKRDPDPEGFEAWVRVIEQNPQDVRTMVHGFVTSTEYRARFGKP